MADTTNGADQRKPDQSREPSVERRLLMAFVLMGAVLFLTPYLYRLFSPQEPARTAQTQAPKTESPKPAAVKPEARAPEKAAPAKPAPGETPPPAPVSAAKPETVLIETDLYRIAISNQGATVRSWLLKNYKDGAGQPLELVSAPGSDKVGYPFALAIPKDDKLEATLNQALFSVKRAGPLEVEMEFSDGAVVARKTFTFRNGSYISKFSTSVTRNGEAVPHLAAWRGGFGDAGVQNRAGGQRAVYYDPSTGDLITKSAGDADDGAITESGAYFFAGIQDNYFAAVFLPLDVARVEVRTVSDNVPAVAKAKDEPHVGVAVGGESSNSFDVFVGPKDVDLLKGIDPRLAELVDFGKWFGWLAKPLFLILDWLNDSFVHNFGWAIVLVTIVINTALLPLKLKSMKSMKRMQSLQPQIAAINAKYKNVGLRDPRKAEQNQEVMELYKKHGINPMGGCLPMVLQIPFFIGFYNVLTVAIEMRGAQWLWVHDLSQPENLPIRILPIAMIVAQFVQQKMTPNPSADPNQQRMMLIMPLIFGFMFYSVSSGLVLYWLTSNLVGIVQQYFINKSMPAAPVAAAPQPASKPRKTSGSRK